MTEGKAREDAEILDGEGHRQANCEEGQRLQPSKGGSGVGKDGDYRGSGKELRERRCAPGDPDNREKERGKADREANSSQMTLNNSPHGSPDFDKLSASARASNRSRKRRSRKCGMALHLWRQAPAARTERGRFR